MPPLATQWSICKLFKQILLLCLLELLITSKQKSNQKRSPGKRLKPHSERGWGGSRKMGICMGFGEMGKWEMRGKLKRECAANKQNVNGEADESDNIVASDFQLFFIFLCSNKRHSRTGASLQGGHASPPRLAWLMQKWIMWLPQQSSSFFFLLFTPYFVRFRFPCTSWPSGGACVKSGRGTQ